jgi:hypothetical protein
MDMTATWIPTCNKPDPRSPLPPERRVVLLWLKDRRLPWCGYLRYAAGDKECPYWVLYRVDVPGFEITHYADCLPVNVPPGEGKFYEKNQMGL